jgi:RasGEF domain
MDRISYRSFLSHIQIFETTLGNAFANLQLDDFLNSKGLGDEDHASGELKAFYHVQNQLGYWVKDDILQHGITKSQAKMFTHWVDVASHLLKTGNHAGFLVVMTSLKSTDVSNLHLEKYCKRKTAKQYANLSKLVATDNNFANYRNYCEKKRVKGNIRLPNLTLLSRDLIYLDAGLGDDKLSPLQSILANKPALYPVAMKKWQIVYDCMLMRNAIDKKELGVPEKGMYHKIERMNGADPKHDKLWHRYQSAKTRIKDVIGQVNNSPRFFSSPRKKLTSRTSSREFIYSQVNRDKVEVSVKPG